jgi:hypothetical protein
VKSNVVLGMMAEIAMKAKLLKKRLKDDPNCVVEVLRKIDVLEEEMLVCLVEFESLGSK